MQELIQIDILAEVFSVNRGPDPALKVVKLFDGRNAVDGQVNRTLIGIRSKYLIDARAKFGVRQLWFKVALTIQGSCLHERLGLIVRNLEKHAVRWDLLPVIDFDNVAHFDIGEARLLPGHLPASAIGLSRARQR